MATTAAMAVAATLVPALRAARTSTVLALTDSARAPRRTAWLIAFSARLPVPLLVGLRVAARRPRRVVLGAVSIAVTVSGIVAVLAAHADLNAGQLDDSARIDRSNQVLLLIAITLIALAAVTAIFITWATVLDARHSWALARALGATPHDISTGLSAAQVLPALAGAVLGIPGRYRTLCRTQRRPDDPAALAAARRGTGNPAHAGGAHHRSSPPRRPPRRGRDPSIRTCLMIGHRRLNDRTERRQRVAGGRQRDARSTPNRHRPQQIDHGRSRVGPSAPFEALSGPRAHGWTAPAGLGSDR